MAVYRELFAFESEFLGIERMELERNRKSRRDKRGVQQKVELRNSN